MKHHGIGGRAEQYRVMGQPEIESLTPLLTWLEGRFGRRNTKAPATGPLRSISEPLEVVIREDDHSKVNGVWVHVQLKDTFEEAGRAAATCLSRLAVIFDKGSFSGMTVGDWTAKNVYGGEPALVFTRKNVFVRVLCQKAVEINKTEKANRAVADPGVNDMCEALARDIDAQIDRLPGRKM